jgi:hypothetical protein
MSESQVPVFWFSPGVYATTVTSCSGFFTTSGAGQRVSTDVLTTKDVCEKGWSVTIDCGAPCRLPLVRPDKKRLPSTVNKVPTGTVSPRTKEVLA